jgi:hypothetical protein
VGPRDQLTAVMTSVICNNLSDPVVHMEEYGALRSQRE